MTRAAVRVVVVGAGAAGLFLAARLASDGFEVRAFEARPNPTRHSRAIGIHPPGLEALDRIGAAEPLLDGAVRVRRGHAFDAGPRRGVRRLGTLDFGAHLPPPFPFVATAPQHRTEAVLAARLDELAPGALRRGVRVAGWQATPDGVDVEVASDAGTDHVRADVLIAATGAGGDAAARAGVRVRGGRYGDAYVMCDLDDDGVLERDAAIYLADDGVIEAFPLAGGVRRWVVKTEGRLTNATAEAATDRIAARLGPNLGLRLDPASARMTSAFGVERRLADRLSVGRVWLCGDAAHVVAPIGGQGMTLGWLGAETAAQALAAWRDGRVSLEGAAARYDATQRARARRAIARGGWNVRLGRATRLGRPRAALIRALLAPPLAGRLARAFTMRS